MMCITDLHPVLMADGSWKPVGEIKQGDQLESAFLLGLHIVDGTANPNGVVLTVLGRRTVTVLPNGKVGSSSGSPE